ENMSARGIKNDPVRVRRRGNRFDDFKCLEIEDTDYAGLAIVGVAVADSVRNCDTMRAAGKWSDIADHRSPGDIDDRHMIAMGDISPIVDVVVGYMIPAFARAEYDRLLEDIGRSRARVFSGLSRTAHSREQRRGNCSIPNFQGAFPAREILRAI